MPCHKLFIGMYEIYAVHHWLSDWLAGWVAVKMLMCFTSVLRLKFPLFERYHEWCVGGGDGVGVQLAPLPFNITSNQYETFHQGNKFDIKSN